MKRLFFECLRDQSFERSPGIRVNDGYPIHLQRESCLVAVFKLDVGTLAFLRNEERIGNQAL